VGAISRYGWRKSHPMVLFGRGNTPGEAEIAPDQPAVTVREQRTSPVVGDGPVLASARPGAESGADMFGVNPDSGVVREPCSGDDV
jgi:hypothetical protein